MLIILLFKLYSCTSKLLHNSWIVKFWKIWIVCIFICGNVFWNSRQCMESLTCFTTNSIYMILEWKVTVNKIPNNFSQFLLCMMEPLTLTGKFWQEKKQKMTFRSICFQVVETEPFKKNLSSCFKVMYNFIKCKSAFARSGIIKVCKARSIVLKKQITKTYVKQYRFTYRSPRYTINYV